MKNILGVAWYADKFKTNSVFIFDRAESRGHTDQDIIINKQNHLSTYKWPLSLTFSSLKHSPLTMKATVASKAALFLQS